MHTLLEITLIIFPKSIFLLLTPSLLQGDSGGPLAHQDTTSNRFILRGVVSQGYGCGLQTFPGLYVPVAEQRYLAWIKEVAFSEP